MITSPNHHASHWQSETHTTNAIGMEVHQHLDDNSFMFDEQLVNSYLASAHGSETPKQGVMFKFFEAQPMSQL